jgi:glutamate dehydrogenase/leucine dehydrogenase
LWSAFVGSAGAARIADFPGCEPITQEEFLALPVTGFLPCALAHTVTHRNAELLGARIVVPGANNPLTPEARILLERRGVLVLPDFVTNAGGVMGGALEFGGLRPALVDDLVCDVLADAVRRLLDRSEALGSPPIDLAEKTALARFERMKSASSSRIALGALSLRREKRIPKWISAPLAELYVRQLRRRLARYE